MIVNKITFGIMRIYAITISQYYKIKITKEKKKQRKTPILEKYKKQQKKQIYIYINFKVFIEKDFVDFITYLHDVHSINTKKE